MRKLPGQMNLVEQVHWLFPETAIVIVGDTEDVALADLAWDPGRSVRAFLPLLAREHFVEEIVAGLMEPVLPILSDTGTELELSDDASG